MIEFFVNKSAAPLLDAGCFRMAFWPNTSASIGNHLEFEGKGKGAEFFLKVGSGFFGVDESVTANEGALTLDGMVRGEGRDFCGGFVDGTFEFFGMVAKVFNDGLCKFLGAHFEGACLFIENVVGVNALL